MTGPQLSNSSLTLAQYLTFVEQQRLKLSPRRHRLIFRSQRASHGNHMQDTFKLHDPQCSIPQGTSVLERETGKSCSTEDPS
ncbi:hypothetical protein J6590_090402 [Homalodisca vitripennis]|nr:hypothetical protein J6590_090402 [Homalodisca vitripennis]